MHLGEENKTGEVELFGLLRTILQELDDIKRHLRLSVQKESYSTKEVAEQVGRAPFTVRQWCNLGQVRAVMESSRGRKGEWRVTHEELGRIMNEGPSAEGTFDNKGRGDSTATCRRAA